MCRFIPFISGFQLNTQKKNCAESFPPISGLQPGGGRTVVRPVGAALPDHAVVVGGDSDLPRISERRRRSVGHHRRLRRLQDHAGEGPRTSDDGKICNSEI